MHYFIFKLRYFLNLFINLQLKLKYFHCRAFDIVVSSNLIRTIEDIK